MRLYMFDIIRPRYIMNTMTNSDLSDGLNPRVYGFTVHGQHTDFIDYIDGWMDGKTSGQNDDGWRNIDWRINFLQRRSALIARAGNSIVCMCILVICCNSLNISFVLIYLENCNISPVYTCTRYCFQLVR